jgi:AraC family transcriptional regulator of adaptative response / DNA-3-methyladenine glycosylase II
VEVVDARCYLRVTGDATSPGWLRVSERRGEHALTLELHGTASAALLGVVERVRRMFDLDADPRAIGNALSRDPRLRTLVRKRPGLRLPSGWDGFEIAVRAVVGQQVSVAAARTIVTRLAERFGTPLPASFNDTGLRHFFPAPEALADADLSGIGLTGARAATIRGIARAVLEGTADFRVERTLEDFVARWTALPGIGPWTAQYIALRALGHPDAFPAEDLVLQKHLPEDGSRLSAKALLQRAEPWRPWRGYAVIQLWRDAALTQHADAAGKASTPRTTTARRTAA